MSLNFTLSNSELSRQSQYIALLYKEAGCYATDFTRRIYIDSRLNTDDLSGEVRICWRHCSNNSGSLPLTPSGRSSLKSADQNTTQSRNSCPEKELNSYASSIVLHSCQKRICRHVRGSPKYLFFSEQEQGWFPCSSLF
ncbi:uncharacterized protein [Malus domestica]|uniref:uncharacterized protein isoform X2 n=1 Tax=Malus domestica TaxID=3750 RepID=UPI0039753C72